VTVGWALTWLLGASFALDATAAPNAPTALVATRASPAHVLDAEGCVALALRTSAKIEEADAKVAFYAARLAEMDATVWPKIAATAFLAPMYTVRGNGFDEHPEVKFKSLRDWGPFVNVEARVAQPLYGFGRAAAARGAARARRGVEEARLEEVTLQLAREVRKLYYLRLYARSMRPALQNARGLLDEAGRRAEAMHAAKSGDVTQVDLARLAYGSAELDRRIDEAALGDALALAALKQSVGLAADAPLEQREPALLVPNEAQLARDVEPLPALMQAAALHRPEWTQLRHGQEAAGLWAKAERLALLPQLLLVGQANFAYTPTRDRDPNPWHYDVYNRRTAGLALVLKFDLDPGQALAKARQADATGAQLVALHRFAATGIPLEVRAAHESLAQLRRALDQTGRGVAATRRWMRFAAAALAAGTGDARDVLEGTANYLQAKQAQMSTVQAYYGKLAELTYAVGRSRQARPSP
jgi:outer membrane protein TolC